VKLSDVQRWCFLRRGGGVGHVVDRDEHGQMVPLCRTCGSVTSESHHVPDVICRRCREALRSTTAEEAVEVKS
jgi:hypothetical protein